MNTPHRARQFILVGTSFAWAISIASLECHAHFGGFLIQLQNGGLIVGQDSETPGQQPNWDTQAVGSLFAPDQYSDLPSFLSLAVAPAGTQPLPTNTNIYWDFLPMTVNGYTSNLLYWDGQGAVNFGPVPVPPGATDVTMGIYNVTDGTSAIVSDTPDMKTGALLGITNNSGTGLRLHRHNYFLLDDGDGVAPTNVAEGVYVIALQLRMPGYGTSQPIFVVPGTYGLVSTSLSTLTTAVAWVEENEDVLIRDGDYDFDGDVDTGDYMAWTRQFATVGPYPLAGDGDYADGNRDGQVDAADYVYWRKLAEPTAGGGAAVIPTTVPEPSSVLLLACQALIAMSCRSKRDRVIRGR
jgi:hypothetical protein